MQDSGLQTGCKLVDFNKVRGCMIKGWCPNEDIYNSEVTTRRVTMNYQSINFSIVSVVSHGSTVYTNLENNEFYPGSRSNKFNVGFGSADGHGHETDRFPPEWAQQGWTDV